MSDNKIIITPKPPKGEDGYRTFSIRVREETVNQLDCISQRTGRSRNELVGMFLEYGLSHSEIIPKEQ